MSVNTEYGCKYNGEFRNFQIHHYILTLKFLKLVISERR